MSKFQESSTSSSISSPHTLTQESIREIKGAIIGELQDKFKQLRPQSTKVLEDLGEIRENVQQFQKKVNKRAESLEHHMWRISRLFDEDRDYGVERIAKEVGTLKGKISEAITKFGSMLVDFDK